jgi:hypothetical protein
MWDLCLLLHLSHVPGMIVNLQRMLDGLDPSRGDRLDDPELENMYQKVVELQPQIVTLMKKYADQRGESFSQGPWICAVAGVDGQSSTR